MTRTLSPKALETLKGYEQFVSFVYDDARFPPRPYKREDGPPKGTLTVGYGHTDKASGYIRCIPGVTVSLAEAEKILYADLEPFCAAVERLVKVPLSQGQFDALVLWNFNTGELAKSTLLKKLNSGDYKSVPAELMKWTHSKGVELPGLVKRRRAECALWRSGDTTYDDTLPAPASTPVDAPKAKPITKSKEAIASTAVVAGGTFQALGAVNDQVKTVTSQLSDAKSSFDVVVTLVTDGRFIAAAVTVALGAAIFFWRKQRLVEDAN